MTTSSGSGYLSELFNLQGRVVALTGAGGFLVSEMSRDRKSVV